MEGQDVVFQDGLWCSVLGYEGRGVDDSYVALVGHGKHDDDVRATKAAGAEIRRGGVTNGMIG